MKKRVLKTLIHFDIAVLLFLVVGLTVGKTYDWQNYVFCWIGWESIGNSNWFIFVILALYIITFVSMALANIKGKHSASTLIISVSVLSIALWVPLFLVKGSIWCNTLLCYPIGMLFSLIKPRLDEIVQRKKLIYYVITASLTILFAGLYLIKANVIIYSIVSCLFVLLLAMITVKVKIDNKILRWLGKYSFSIYILQRLPMIVFKHMGLAENIVVFSLLSITATLLLSVAYQKLTDLVDKKCLN